MSKPENKKTITKKSAELICHKADIEGFDYCFTEYSSWEKETKGTNLEPLIKAYQKASNDLKKALDQLREKFNIEVQ